MAMLFLFFSVLCSCICLATGQEPDKIDYYGVQYDLLSNPMETYFKKFPEKILPDEIASTGLWRGYVANFGMIDSQLYLVDLTVYKMDASTGDTQKVSVFKEWFGDTKFKCDFYTGVLTLPYGNLTEYVHMGYGSTYENYILLEINQGGLTKTKQLTQQEYTVFKERQFKAFKKTEAYRDIYNEMA